MHYLTLSLRQREPDAMTSNIDPAPRPLRNTPNFNQLLEQASLVSP